MNSWRDAIRHGSFRIRLLICLVGLLLLVLFLPYFFNDYLLIKPGIVLKDGLQQIFTPRDFSIPIFVLIYGALILFISRHAKKPSLILYGLEAYLILQVLRVMSLSILTLEPPDGIIPLTDPFVAKVAYGVNVFNKDLFFSGHTATLFLLILFEQSNRWKLLLSAITLAVALLLVIQRVHYTLDILAAPPAALLSFYLAGLWQPRQN